MTFRLDRIALAVALAVPALAQNASVLAPATLDARDFNFVRVNGSQTPSSRVDGNLAFPGNGKVLTFPVAPKGLKALGYVYVTGGFGNAEAAQISATTCSLSGGTECTVTINTSNAHTGSWSVKSACAGIQEAINVAADTGVPAVLIPRAANTYVDYVTDDSVAVIDERRLAAVVGAAANVFRYVRFGSLDGRLYVASIYTDPVHIDSLQSSETDTSGSALQWFAQQYTVRARRSAVQTVALHTICESAVNNSDCYGFNPIVGTAAGVTNAKLIGIEVDVEPSNGTTVRDGGGVLINAFNVAMPVPAIQVGSINGSFGNGIILAGIASNGAGIAAQSGSSAMNSLINTAPGTFTGDAIILGNGHATRYQGTGSAHAKIYNDSSNYLRIVAGATNTVVVRNNNDTNYGDIAVGLGTFEELRIATPGGDTSKIYTDNTGYTRLVAGSANRFVIRNNADTSPADLAVGIVDSQDSTFTVQNRLAATSTKGVIGTTTAHDLTLQTHETEIMTLVDADKAIQLKDTGIRPTCNAGRRGEIWYDAGGPGVADSFAICAKDGADSYAWRTIY